MRKRVALSDVQNPRPAQTVRQSLIDESRFAACRARQLITSACLHDSNARDLRERMNIELEKHAAMMAEARQHAQRAHELEQQIMLESKGELS